MNKSYYSIFILLIFYINANAQPGTLDASFGIGGKVITDVSLDDDCGYAVALQSDEKIVVAGTVSSSNHTDIVLLRYTRDGTLDSTFDSDGIVHASLGGMNIYAYALLVQPDGKIVVGGGCESFNNDFLLLRYKSDGKLDSTFSNDGVVITSIGPKGDYCRSLALQTDGKIVATGAYQDSDYVFATVRYTSDGGLDTSFNHVGIVPTVVGTGSAFAYSVKIQTDGKIVISGYAIIGSDYQML